MERSGVRQSGQTDRSSGQSDSQKRVSEKSDKACRYQTGMRKWYRMSEVYSVSDRRTVRQSRERQTV